jgi:hypothetical protein
MRRQALNDEIDRDQQDQSEGPSPMAAGRPRGGAHEGNRSHARETRRADAPDSVNLETVSSHSTAPQLRQTYSSMTARWKTGLPARPMSRPSRCIPVRCVRPSQIQHAPAEPRTCSSIIPSPPAASRAGFGPGCRHRFLRNWPRRQVVSGGVCRIDRGVGSSSRPRAVLPWGHDRGGMGVAPQAPVRPESRTSRRR